MNLSVVFGIVEQALKLWNSKDADKFLIKTLRLKKKWYDEYTKPLNIRSDAELDDIELQLEILCKTIVDSFKAKDFKN